MSYSTKTDILNYCSDQELAQITSESGDTVDDIIVNKAITDADGEIDSYLGVKYSVPLATPIPAMVCQLSSKIALYNLYSRRAGQIGMNETVEKNKDDAIKFLQKVSTGDASIGIDPPPAATATNSVRFHGRHRKFTGRKMNAY